MNATFIHFYLGPDDEWRQQSAALTTAFRTPRGAMAYIMDNFLIMKRKDEAMSNGNYCTKRTILEIYDALAESIQTGKAYETRLTPAPSRPAM